MILTQFLKDPIRTGAVGPSSAALVDMLLSAADVESRKAIVELGSGDGVVTEQILARNADSFVFGLELNPVLAKKTKERCKDALIYADNATQIMKYLKKHRQSSCDCIVSTLPWAAFGKMKQKEILSAIHSSLIKKGRFVTVAYKHGMVLPGGRNFRRLLNDSFSGVERTPLVWRNFPPAFVYSCIK